MNRRATFVVLAGFTLIAAANWLVETFASHPNLIIAVLVPSGVWLARALDREIGGSPRVSHPARGARVETSRRSGGRVF